MLSFNGGVIAALAVALSTLTNQANALYDANSKNNLAMYWGQGPGQLDLLYYCQQPEVDIIPIGFVHISPANGNGYPGTNFGNQCGGAVYPGPGPNPDRDQLQSACAGINRAIPVCQQTYGKRIILSLGGGAGNYAVNGEQEGIEFADFLWGAFGPQTAEWMDAGKPRPFDGENGEEVQVDGFDMDVEYPSADSQVGWIALIRRLRELFATGNKEYLITGAPQCVVPDANMGAMIAAAEFDILFVQFYNTGFCSARDYADRDGVNSEFSYDEWSDFLVGTASANAKLYIGLPGSPAAAGGGGVYWLNPAETKAIVEDFYCRDNFGGVMIWEATRANEQIDGGQTYYKNVADIIGEVSRDTSLECVIGQPSSSSSIVSSTTTVSTVSSSTSSSVSSSLSSTLSSSTSSDLTSSATVSSTSSTPTSTSESSVLSSSSSSVLSSSTSATSSSATLSTSSSISSSESSALPSSTTSLSSSTSATSSSATLSTSSSISSSESSALPSSTTSLSSSTSAPSSSSAPTSSLASSAQSSSILPSSTTAPSSSAAISTSSLPSSTLAPTSAIPSTSSTRSTSATPSPTGLRPSVDGSCGAGITCGSRCCSRFGWCGDSSLHCDAGCQSVFGTCKSPSPSPSSSSPATPSPSAPVIPVFPVTQDGACGGGAMKRCAGGGCCSVWGWCGATPMHCGSGYCQPGFGLCT